MKGFRILGRNIRDSFKSVFRNFSLSLASISCITITLIVVAFSIVLSYNVNNIADKIEKDVTIVTFIKNEVKEEDLDTIRKQLDKLDNIESITFQSKQEISKEMMNSSETFKNIIGGWDDEENPIQNTYLVKVIDIDLIGDTAKQIDKIEGVDFTQYGAGMVEKLVASLDIVKNIALGTVLALVIVTAFLIINTIKITIVSRKREIEIMRLVGASNINIKIPFIFEGLLLGILGAIIPIIVTTYGYTAIYDYFDGKIFTPIIQLIAPTPFVYIVSLILLILGILVGMFGSWRAVKKYLKI